MLPLRFPNSSDFASTRDGAIEDAPKMLASGFSKLVPLGLMEGIDLTHVEESKEVITTYLKRKSTEGAGRLRRYGPRRAEDLD
ncbi:hypothetical protein BHM03_00005670 [Ensete ventricosum]|uniref:Uncharacterized protein n=1 Tax=Ensete ventricosum TaxID=4639 RepID=A0A426X8W9_ENSVE|nr:hypothetical protein B296_00052205 [Ensete ventricosum]RZR79822.1 hypothetical protein BHM03_00005670 [Ensete ventricosum]